MVIWKIYRSDEVVSDSYYENMVEWLHTLPPLSWEGNDEGIVVYAEPPVKDGMEYGFVGDYITAVGGKPRIVRGADVQLDGGFAIFTLDGVRYRVGLGK